LVVAIMADALRLDHMGVATKPHGCRS
jgi:hypothetical protein